MLAQIYVIVWGDRTEFLYWIDGGWLAGFNTLLAWNALHPGSRRVPVVQWLVWSTLLAVIALQVGRFGLEIQEWDILWISIWLTVALGFELARGIPERMHRALRRLVDRRVLGDNATDVSQLSCTLDRNARRLALIGGVCASFVFILTTGPSVGLHFLRGTLIWPQPFTTHFPAVLTLAFAIGANGGMMAAYGRLGSAIRRLGLPVRIVPGHIDKAGGLRPVGIVLLYQSLVVAVAVPALFLMVWLILFTRGFASRYGAFIDAYLWLLMVPITLGLLVFVLPMISVHKIMRADKEGRLWCEADQLSLQVEEIRRCLESGTTQDREARESQLDRLLWRIKMLEKAPTWPVDASIFGIFVIQNLSLLIPLISKA